MPLRIAPLGEGFREPNLEEKLAQAPQQPFGSPEGADKDAAAGMAQALLKTGDYKDAYAYLKSAPEATPAYMAAVHDAMRQKNPELAMKFAEQGVENGMAKPVQLAQADTGIMSDGVPASAPPAQPSAPSQPPVANPAQGTAAGTPEQPTQGQGAGSPPANAGGKPLPAPKLDPKYGDSTTPPKWKKDTFANQGDAWPKFNTATANLPGATETEKFVYGQIFAAEGGNLEDPKSKASSGVLPSTLEEAKASGKFPGLETVAAPKDMNADQRAQVMQWHVDRSLNRVGGAKMLDNIDDKAAAFGMADLLVRFGRNGGGTELRRIINKIEGDGTVESTGSVNTKTFEAYRRLTANPETRDRVLNAIADRFKAAGEIDRANHHRPGK